MTSAISPGWAALASRVVAPRASVRTARCGAVRTRSGDDGVDSDAGGAELGCPGPGHRRQCGLGGAVGGATGETDLAGHAPDVDDAAASPSGHLRCQRSDEEVRRSDVGGEKPIEGRHVELRRRSEPGEPGVVDQDVDPADLLDQTLQLGRIAEIGGHEARLAALGCDGVNDCFTTAGVASVHDDFGAVAGELLGRRLADA